MSTTWSSISILLSAMKCRTGRLVVEMCCISSFMTRPHDFAIGCPTRRSPVAIVGQPGGPVDSRGQGTYPSFHLRFSFRGIRPRYDKLFPAPDDVSVDASTH